MNGINHIAETFSHVRSQNRAALIPYFTLGYPDPDACLSILEAIANAGADLIELGVPFSDPLADGPTIQRSTHRALEGGMTVQHCLDLTRQLRARGATQPLLLMGYYNPILAYGVSRFVNEAAAAGADGFIVPDLPPEEAQEMQIACEQHQLALVYLLAPTSPPERVAFVAGQTTGFLYLVSLTGVTGARDSLPADLDAFVSRVRDQAATPVAVGFGISTPAQARAVGGLADGVIVGSALINAVDRSSDPCLAAAEFVSRLREALAV
ncbi:MAG TPA: tryptophan synthase subunit alpha [Anaerolineales bacterium]|jgi:tryptophan synthase alpha chain|nr:tryptophan synthase subunit alpha [Anaerolineales bacterium]